MQSDKILSNCTCKKAMITIKDDQDKKQKSWLTILSGSMIPLLQISDKVLVHYEKPAEIRVLDMIVFKTSDKLIALGVIRKYINL